MNVATRDGQAAGVNIVIDMASALYVINNRWATMGIGVTQKQPTS